MKLYITASSERATKGQGGNKEVKATVTAEIEGERKEIATMTATNEEEKYNFTYTLPNGKKGKMKVKKNGKK